MASRQRHKQIQNAFSVTVTISAIAVLVIITYISNDLLLVEGFGIGITPSTNTFHNIAVHSDLLAQSTMTITTESQLQVHAMHDFIISSNEVVTQFSSSLSISSLSMSSSSEMMLFEDITITSSSSNKEILLWTIRIFSACLTYFGFVAVADRPRGRMDVPFQLTTNDDDNNDNNFLRVGESIVAGAGLGLFAIQSLPKGTLLGTYPGVVIPLEQHSVSKKVQQFPFITEYIWRFTDNKYIIDPTNHKNGLLDDYCIGGNPSQPFSVPLFQLLHTLLLLSSIITKLNVPTALCRINEPPKGYDVNVITEENLKSRCVTFVVERDVFAGEELYIDYGLTYDRSGYNIN